MNSEELELSLRTEFESYLKNIFAEMRQETAAFQEKVQADLDQHRARTEEAFHSFAARFDAENSFDQGFTESVTEHLRLARDEGARLTANAVAEAEKLDSAEAAEAAETAEAIPAPADFSGIRDAIADISSKTSQSSILKSLVGQASQFAPRGAFFIIKSEQFVGWKLYGNETEGVESSIREIHISTSANSVLSDAVSTRNTVEGSYGSHADDADFLTPLDFGEPTQMYAIPLVARGRGVAVLYADAGAAGEMVNVEALETLVRIAGLTVELLAASQAAKEDASVAAADFEHTQDDGEPGTSYDTVESYADQSPVAGFESQSDASDFAFSDSVSYEGGFGQEHAFPPADEPEPVAESEPAVSRAFEDEIRSFEPQTEAPAVEEAFSYESETHAFEPAAETHLEEESHSFEPAAETYVEDAGHAFEPAPETHVEEETHAFEPVAETPVEEHAFEPAHETSDFSSTISDNEGPLTFDSGGSIEPAAFESSPAAFESSPFDQTAHDYEPANGTNGAGAAPVEPTPEPVVEAVTAPVSGGQGRLSDRPVDLPIEVPEEERRSHNDARRFARLLVSEIKLYNEKKVQEGREASDLYDRLREAIDRSREMYDKRVQQPVAAKFDYFHYELVNALAEGDEHRLGNSYPGASI